MEKNILSVIMPVYNEKTTIIQIIKKIRKSPIKKEIIIVDDFSADGTREILKKINAKNIKIIYHDKNYGKGYAVRTALKHAKGSVILIQDADLEYDPKEYQKLVSPILKGNAKVVYGTRFKKKQKISMFYLGNRFLTFAANILYSAKITDEATCYKVFESSVIKNLNLKCRRFEFCPEVTSKLIKKGHSILEVPISYSSRSLKEGKKIKWGDGFHALWILIKYKFTD